MQRTRTHKILHAKALKKVYPILSTKTLKLKYFVCVVVYFILEEFVVVAFSDVLFEEFREPEVNRHNIEVIVDCFGSCLKWEPFDNSKNTILNFLQVAS